MQLLFSRRAEFDLEEIGDYIAKDNPTRAASFVREIIEHCRRLINFPKAAPLRREFGEGVRLSVFGRYLIFYVAHGELLEIRRVVHGARNLSDIM
jgi:toxin ParE1/3/4